MSTTTAATIVPARQVRGRIRVPGDKSISHRYALLAALADGTSRLTNYAPGADCRSTLACLRGLGVAITEDTTSATIIGRGLGRLGSPAGPLDAGNSGTTMRLIGGCRGHPFTPSGGRRLVVAPASRALNPERMGARIEAADGSAVDGSRRRVAHIAAVRRWR